MSTTQPVRTTTEPVGLPPVGGASQSVGLPPVGGASEPAGVQPVGGVSGRTDRLAAGSTPEARRRTRRRPLTALLRAAKARFTRRYRQVLPRQAQTLVDCGTLVLDVREPHEFQAGHLPGSQNIPLRELVRRKSELAEAPVLVVDRSGPRSELAAAMLADEGHETYDLRGGLRAWDYSGRPLTTADGGSGTVL
ncbi:rhodanese-like domain-containing protein [Georgenia subflava]|uniref:Rhodanese domain-containing protein n=1 Tax=Georgenia subflava TaxID=1622177 RepID=A0A6N7EIA7_9MICO|nr:rhodanese-like domain-containing protein [Georgenia subflava]MPV35886.1 hypothetical protein [Georgenia subflava]